MSGLLSNSGGNDDKPVKPAGEGKSADDLANFFAEPDDKDAKPDKEDKSDKGDKEDKPDKGDKDDKLDIDDDDIELKDPDEEEDKLDLEDKKSKGDEDIEIDAPPKKKEILAKYPNFLKEFPFFEKMMYRDRQYTELFGSFDDAKEVAEKSEVLDKFEDDLLKGNTETILTKVKEIDKKAFDKIVDDYLPTLARVDKEAYLEVIGNIGRHIIRQMVTEAKSVASSNKEQGDAINQAALLLNQFLFGTSTYTPPKARVEKTDERDTELERERTEFARERFETKRNDLQTKVDNTLRATITDYIDRDNQMTGYVKKNAVRDALTMLHTAIGNDPAFRKNLDRLWESAFSSRFDKNSIDRIRSMYLGKAKNMLPAIIKKARAEALKDQTPSSRRDKDDEDKEDTSRKREPINSGRPRQQSGGKLKMEKGESVLDFLSRD